MRSIIKQNLTNTYGYEKVIVIKLSEFILRHYTKKLEEQKGRTHAYSDLIHKIEGGDTIRREFHNNSILVELAIQQIREDRQEIETTQIKGRRVCYIIDSLKNIEELRLLRSVYRDIFYLFSIFSPEEERKKTLIEKGLAKDEAKEITEKDEYEDFDHGQHVRKTFVDGDFFIRSSKSNQENIKKNIEKYLHLIFDSQIITPTHQETAMYYAKSSAGNSACLSRQVGAAITDKNGIVLAQGWNDVPKCFGNVYRDSDDKPIRCKELGYCSNVKHRDEIYENIIEEIDKILPKENSEQSVRIKKKSKLGIDIEKILRKSDFKNIIEYSRSIHAEMNAVIIGSQLTGDKMIGGNLYCTTYPCHNCARHIVLAGIKNIYYIEPYKKSLCLTLHKDSLTEDENDETRVRILLYDGVAPRRYLDFFSMNNDNRKEKDGALKHHNCKTLSPKNRLSLQAIPELENQAIHALLECGFLKEEEL
ncbi:cytidine deaminase [Bacteroidia bacterium]|nr:cytidine deaminase [Bacteroidia bacterium]